MEWPEGLEGSQRVWCLVALRGLRSQSGEDRQLARACGVEVTRSLLRLQHPAFPLHAASHAAVATACPGRLPACRALGLPGVEARAQLAASLPATL